MRAWRGRRSLLVVFTAAVLAAPLAGITVSARSAVAGPVSSGVHAGASTLDNFLEGVSAANASNVWAVGYYSAASADQALIERWDGTSWKIQPSPDPGGPSRNSSLWGASAVSPSLAHGLRRGTRGAVSPDSLL